MPSLRELWRLEGSVGRGIYAAAGVLGFAVKYSIDFAIASLVFNAPWSPLSYWRLIRFDGNPQRITPGLFLALLCVAIPFLWFGMAMTLLRLRDAGRSAGWAALFFVPVLNVVLFAVLCLLPRRPVQRARDLSGTLESALFAVVLTLAVTTIAIALATRVVFTYGAGLFIAVPFSVGYLSAFIQRRRHGTAARPYLVATLSLLLLGGLLLALAWEGIVCLAMAFPLAFVVALLGAYCGARMPRTSAASAYFVAALLPLAIVGESALRRTPPVYRVDTAVIVNAPIDRVWKNVIAFPAITDEPEWYFRAGISYPLRARIVDTTRFCEFTTGAFVEPITVWDEPRLLRFRVASNPPPLTEWSPYGAIDAPHLQGFLVSSGGQFALTPLDGHRTRLAGTTWYRHSLWPASYWRLWSDAIIHRIHLRVLRHIQQLSEAHPIR
jgi:hypothetical protein